MATTALHLAYHYVRDEEAPCPRCTPARLRRQIEFLGNEGFEFLTCADVVAGIKTGIGGRSELPPKYAVLSFDDGLSDHRRMVLPILEEYRIRATFFVIGCTLERVFPPVIGFQVLLDDLGVEIVMKDVLPGMLRETRYAPLCTLITLDWLNGVGLRQGEPPELRAPKYIFNDLLPHALKTELLDEAFAEYFGDESQKDLADGWFLSKQDLAYFEASGMEIGAHSMTHPFFNISAVKEIEAELTQSRDALRDAGVRWIPSFAYPFGERVRIGVRNVVMSYFQSAWTYVSASEMSPLPGRSGLDRIPRLNEARCALFEEF